MTKFNKSLLSILCAFTALPINANTDNVCSSNEFLGCIGINQEQCIKATNESLKTCTEKYPFMQQDNKDIFMKMAGENAQCTTGLFIKLIGANSEEYYACSSKIKHSFK